MEMQKGTGDKPVPFVYPQTRLTLPRQFFKE
jgi:hypothetical protein